ncbi:hypothetical protein P171DRAFT_42444 [Karstenula rhodostoma CBS 690.94]|uniref:Uncharacterized protein n=1 Tax=Karstenula rhodostoma CBS 690.94 TaxID=1392251 RepID=A0A9P4PIV6_9PLEO|nr:hypothetical protein P171DRAFT_42444 [Karstenula rhodostoma CBS 690.94]
MSDMNINFGTTHNGPSEMMDIDPPDMATHQPEDAQKASQEIAHELVDSVMGTPAPDGAAHTPSTPQVLDTTLDLDETTESLVPPQDLQSNEDPQYTEITHIPSIQKLFASYAKSFPASSEIGPKGFNYAKYFDPVRMTKVRAKHGSRLEKAKALAVALLEHYYPEGQGYRVEPAEFPLLQLGGWRTWIYPEDCYDAAEGKTDTIKAALKKNAKPVYDTFAGNIFADKFHQILPEHIAGYVVLSEVQYADGSTHWAQHTYLAIMMDDLDTFQHWVPEKLMRTTEEFVSMPRADILNDAMGRQAGVSSGYAILMLGPRFEFYNYQANPAWEEKSWEHNLGPDPEEADYDPDSAAEEGTSSFSHLGGGDVDSTAWVVDIRSKRSTESLAAVDTLFKSVVGRDVEYRDGYALPGPKI